MQVEGMIYNTTYGECITGNLNILMMVSLVNTFSSVHTACLVPLASAFILHWCSKWLIHIFLVEPTQYQIIMVSAQNSYLSFNFNNGQILHKDRRYLVSLLTFGIIKFLVNFHNNLLPLIFYKCWVKNTYNELWFIIIKS